MTSGLNSTVLMASNAQAASASMPLLKKAAIKPSVAVKIGCVHSCPTCTVQCTVYHVLNVSMYNYMHFTS